MPHSLESYTTSAQLLTGKVHNGGTGETVCGDFSQDLEGPDHAPRLVGLQDVNEQVQPPRVPDGQLTRLLLQVKLQECAEGYDSGRLVPSLQVLDELLDLPVLVGEVGVGLLDIHMSYSEK